MIYIGVGVVIAGVFFFSLIYTAFKKTHTGRYESFDVEGDPYLEQILRLGD